MSAVSLPAHVITEPQSRADIVVVIMLSYVARIEEFWGQGKDCPPLLPPPPKKNA